MVTLNDFLASIKSTENDPISESYKRQFKIKGDFILPSNKLFNPLI